MRKISWLLSALVLSLVFMTGCNSNTSKVDAAIKAADKYKHLEYEVNYSEDILHEDSVIQRNDEMKPLLTENFYQKAVDTRVTILPLQVAHKQQASLKPENLQFSTHNDQKKDIVELKYTVDLVLLDQEGQEKQRVPMEGILTLFDVDGHWLIQGDRLDSVAFRDLIQ